MTLALLDLSRLSHLAAAKTGYRTWSSSRKVDKRRSVVQRKPIVVETCKGGAKPFPLTQIFWKKDQISQAVDFWLWCHERWKLIIKTGQWSWCSPFNGCNEIEFWMRGKHQLTVSRWKVCFGTASHPSCWIWESFCLKLGPLDSMLLGTQR